MEHNPTANAHGIKLFIQQYRSFIYPCIVWVVLGFAGLLLEQNRSFYKCINENNNSFLDAVMPYVTHMGEGLFVVCFLLLFLLLLRPKANVRLILVVIMCNVIPFVVTQIVKQIVNAPRPLKYFNEADWIHRVSGQPINYDFSFPSGHSEGAFALFSSIALMLPKQYRSWGGFLCFMLALSVAYSRIYLSQHFFRDVYVGSLLGTGLSFFVYYKWYYSKLAQS